MCMVCNKSQSLQNCVNINTSSHISTLLFFSLYTPRGIWEQREDCQNAENDAANMAKCTDCVLLQFKERYPPSHHR